jgi:hypothetical protein
MAYQSANRALSPINKRKILDAEEQDFSTFVHKLFIPTTFVSKYIPVTDHSIMTNDEVQDMIHHLINYNRTLGVFKRQCGKTSTLSAYAIWMAYNNPNYQIFFVAGRYTMQNIIEDLALLNIPLYSKTITKIVFENGSTITQGTSCCGHRADLILVDEANFVNDKTFESLLPIANSYNSKVHMFSTICDPFATFAMMYREANAGNIPYIAFGG